jgi:hypothetical protein
MVRGQPAPEGSTYIAQNGYHYTKRNGKYTATHVLVMEEKLGRKLTPNERVRFKDNDRTNFKPENLVLTVKGKTSLLSRRARLVARRDELNAQIQEIDNELELKDTQERLDELEAEASA